MPKVGRRFREWNENKGSLVHSWVGNRQALRGDDFLAVEKQVEVEGTCFRLLRPRPSALLFDLEHQA